jgi:hypothetical protein
MPAMVPNAWRLREPQHIPRRTSSVRRVFVLTSAYSPQRIHLRQVVTAWRGMALHGLRPSGADALF